MQTGNAGVSVAVYCPRSARGGWKSGRVGLFWCKNVIALVCSRNCIATDISEADGWWCVYIMVWTVCPSKSMMST